MPDRPTVKICVILRREALDNRWVSHQWLLRAVQPDAGGEPRTLVEDDAVLERLHPGFDLTLFRDEAEGYYLNASSEEPSVFVSLRTDEATGDAYPFQVTLSYNEAARWMDSNERVERAPAWPELAGWLAQFVADNYKPEPRKRRRPRSFEGKEGVLRAEGDQ